MNKLSKVIIKTLTCLSIQFTCSPVSESTVDRFFKGIMMVNGCRHDFSRESQHPLSYFPTFTQEDMTNLYQEATGMDVDPSMSLHTILMEVARKISSSAFTPALPNALMTGFATLITPTRLDSDLLSYSIEHPLITVFHSYPFMKDIFALLNQFNTFRPHEAKMLCTSIESLNSNLMKLDMIKTKNHELLDMSGLIKSVEMRLISYFIAFCTNELIQSAVTELSTRDIFMKPDSCEDWVEYIAKLWLGTGLSTVQLHQYPADLKLGNLQVGYKDHPDRYTETVKFSVHGRILSTLKLLNALSIIFPRSHICYHMELQLQQNPSFLLRLLRHNLDNPGGWHREYRNGSQWHVEMNAELFELYALDEPQRKPEIHELGCTVLHKEVNPAFALTLIPQDVLASLGA